MTDDISAHWSLDKRVPIAALLAVVLQTGAMIWWASGVEARVGQLEQRHDSTLPSRIAVVESKVDTANQNFGYNRAVMDKIDGKLDTLLNDRKK